MRHIHYVVRAYDSEDSLGEAIGGVTIDVMAEDEGQAISKAQKLAWGRTWYRVITVLEHDPNIEVATQASEPILQQLKDGELTLDRIQILEQTGEVKILPDVAKMRNLNGRS